MRQEFVANVSHELKTPLAVIKACTETLLDGAVEDAERNVRSSSGSRTRRTGCTQLILDLLSLAASTPGRRRSSAEPPSRELVVTCLDRHRPRAEAKNMTLEAVPPAAELTAWADAEAVGPILDNLVDNAVKYTPAGGTVRVTWAAGQDGVAIDVADTGPGIPERTCPRIFARFYRVDRARSRELGGTGLGLAIVKRLTQAMGGSVKGRQRAGVGNDLHSRPAPADRSRGWVPGEL